MRSAPRPQPACYNALPSGDSGLAFRLRSFLRGDGTPPPSRGNGLLDYVHPAWDAPQKKRRCPTICCNIGHRAEKSVSFMLWNLQRPGLTGCCSGAPITRSRVILAANQTFASADRRRVQPARSWTERPSACGACLHKLILKGHGCGCLCSSPAAMGSGTSVLICGLGPHADGSPTRSPGSRRPRPRPIFRQSIAMAIARRITRRGIQVLSPSFAFRFDGGGP